jgi:hypothetical protein
MAVSEDQTTPQYSKCTHTTTPMLNPNTQNSLHPLQFYDTPLTSLKPLSRALRPTSQRPSFPAPFHLPTTPGATEV